MNEKIVIPATLGIARDRMNNFLLAKGKKLISKKRFSKSSLRKTYEEEDLVKSTLLNYSTRASQIELGQIQEQVWMPDYRKCCHILHQIDQIADDIRKEKAKKLVAINDQKHVIAIEKLSQQATNKINRCEKILKQIEKVDEFNENPERRKIFSNILMSLAMKIQQKAKRIRSFQQEDLRERQQLKKFETNTFQATGLMNRDDDQQGEWFNEEGFQVLQQKMAQQRNQQIMKIVKSIQSLNTIYKQLQNIVIQQGSLLDRIDENIDNTAFNIEKANESLTKAEEHQKSPIANRVIFFLVLLIFCCAIILIAR